MNLMTNDDDETAKGGRDMTKNRRKAASTMQSKLIRSRHHAREACASPAVIG